MTQAYSTNTDDDRGDEPIVAMTEPLTAAELRRIEKHVYDVAQTQLSEYQDNRALYPSGRVDA